MWAKLNVAALAANTKALVGIASAMSALGGAAASYVVAQKKLTAKYEAIAEQEIAQAKVFYSKLHKKDEFETPESAARQLIPEQEDVLVDEALAAMRTYQGDAPVKEVVVEETVEKTTNIFVDNEPLVRDDFDMEAELENRRNGGAPFVITKDEYNENETDFEQATVTYYINDDVMIDEKDSVIADTDGVVGNDNLKKFGYGSGDNNVVYVRNEKLGIDFEVLKARGNYDEEVLGVVEPELKHSDRRFRRVLDA